MARYVISLLRGDGIGPEQTAAARKILEAISDNTPIKFTINEVDVLGVFPHRHHVDLARKRLYVGI